jgi:hypothetical protein
VTDQITEMPGDVDAPAEDEIVTPAAGTEAAAAEGPKPITKHKVPDGIATPIEALNAMKQKNLVPADFPPQRMYGFVKSPGKNDAFPVKHYDAAGIEYDTPQLDATGHTTTRPGVVIDEVIAWWSRKGDRDKVKAEEKAAKALAKAEKDKQAAAAAAAKAAGQPAPTAPPVVGSEEAAEAGVTEDVEAE